MIEKVTIDAILNKYFLSINVDLFINSGVKII